MDATLYYLGKAASHYTKRGQHPMPVLTAEFLSDAIDFGQRFFRELFARMPSGALLTLDNHQEIGPTGLLHDILVDALGERCPPRRWSC